MDERNGLFTEKQEKQIDFLWKNTGILEAVDGAAISLADNQVLERLKVKILDKYPDSLPFIYEVVDSVMDSLPKETE